MRTQRGPAPAAPKFDLAQIQELTGTYEDAQRATLAMSKCQELGHLISPVTVVHALPPGVGVGISSVLIDPQRDAYPAPGSSLLALSKRGIDLIAGAAGVAWDPLASGILHKERDRMIFTCAGTVTLLDGRERPIVGTKDMDVRDGSPAVLAAIEKSIAKYGRDNQNCSREEAVREGTRHAQNAVRELRGHLLSHAETKAGLRAVRRAFALRAAYRPEELERPFLVVQAVWTGRSENPELARIFAEKTADRFLGAKDRMYGPERVRRAEVIDVRTTVEKEADAAGVDEDDAPAASRGGVVPPGEAPTSQPAASTPPATPREAPRAGPAAPAEDRGPEASGRLRLPKKGGGGDLLRDATGKSLQWWRDKIAQGLEDGTAGRYQRQNEELLDAIDAEIDWRGGAAEVGGDAPW